MTIDQLIKGLQEIMEKESGEIEVYVVKDSDEGYSCLPTVYVTDEYAEICDDEDFYPYYSNKRRVEIR
jgi:hypothetical protein